MEINEKKYLILVELAGKNVDALAHTLAKAFLDLDAANAKIAELEATLKLPPEAR